MAKIILSEYTEKVTNLFLRIVAYISAMEETRRRSADYVLSRIEACGPGNTELYISRHTGESYFRFRRSAESLAFLFVGKSGFGASNELPLRCWHPNDDAAVIKLAEPFQFLSGKEKLDVWQKAKAGDVKGLSFAAQIEELVPNLEARKESAIYWKDGDGFLAADEFAANMLADLLDALDYDVTTGHYDPKEDAEAGSIDEHTGLWYIHII